MQYRYLLLVAFLACLSNCDSSKTSGTTMDAVETVAKPTAQALLLTQSFTFDPTDKNRATGAYTLNKQVIVPTDLTPQNKWFMFEGPVLENDKIAYRYYADSRHRFDIYGKTVSDLVMDTVSWKYHDIMDWGADILKVGNSLGMGSPGVWYKDSIYTLSDCTEKRIEVLATDGVEAIIRTTFTGLQIADKAIDVIQDWSLSTGNYWSQIDLRVVNGELPQGMAFATGIVKHLPEIEFDQANGYTYAFNWGKQSFHEEKMGMAIMADNKFGPRQQEDELSHLLVFKEGEKDVSYRFMAVWERDQSATQTTDKFRKMVVSATQE